MFINFDELITEINRAYELKNKMSSVVHQVEKIIEDKRRSLNLSGLANNQNYNTTNVSSYFIDINRNLVNKISDKAVPIIYIKIVFKTSNI